MATNYIAILTYDLDDPIPQDYTDLSKKLNEIEFFGTVPTATATVNLTNNTFLRNLRSRKKKKDVEMEILEQLGNIFSELKLKGQVFILVTPDCSMGLKQYRD